MCLGVPGRLLGRDEDLAGLAVGRVSFGGLVKRVCLAYTPEAEPGDYVIVHAGFALARIDEEEAERTLALLDELGELEELRLSAEGEERVTG